MAAPAVLPLATRIGTFIASITGRDVAIATGGGLLNYLWPDGGSDSNGYATLGGVVFGLFLSALVAFVFIARFGLKKMK